MSCCTCGSTPTTVACCSIHGTLGSGIGFRAQLSSPGGATGGAEIPLYTADSGTSVLPYLSNVKLWINHIAMIMTGGGDSVFYRGTSVGDDTLANAVIAGGPYSANGGTVQTVPWVATSLGQRLYIKTATAEFYRITVYGIYETT